MAVPALSARWMQTAIHAVRRSYEAHPHPGRRTGPDLRVSCWPGRPKPRPATSTPSEAPTANAAVVVPEPGPIVQVDDNVAEGLQAGASAIGGAGIALAALWAYRRRHPVGVH